MSQQWDRVLTADIIQHILRYIKFVTRKGFNHYVMLIIHQTESSDEHKYYSIGKTKLHPLSNIGEAQEENSDIDSVLEQRWQYWCTFVRH